MLGRLHISSRKTPLTITIVLCLGAIVAAWYLSHDSILNRGRAIFEKRAVTIKQDLAARIGSYERMLVAAKSLFAASVSVERDEWRAYFEHQAIKKLFPGMSSIGFALRVPQSEIGSHQVQVQQDGVSSYSVWPPGERNEFYPVLYTEPSSQDNMRLLGYDLSSEPSTLAAIEVARDENRAIITDLVSFFPESTSSEESRVFLMMMPVYRNRAVHETVEERRESFLGVVYLAARFCDLVQALPESATRGVRFDIFDGSGLSEEERLYSFKPGAVPLNEGGETALFSYKGLIEVPGKRWTIRFRSQSSFHELLDTEEVVLITGVTCIIALLLIGIVWTRTRALAESERVTDELRRSQFALRQDVTERKRIEQVLRESQLQYSRLVNSIDGIVWQQEVISRRFKFVSPQAERILGFPVQDWVERSDFFFAHLHPEDREETLRLMKVALDEKRSYQHEFRMIAASGATVWLRNVGSITEESSEVRSASGVMFDITDMKAAEDESRHLEAQLRQSHKMEALGTLAGGIAHEFNNILGIIMGYGELLLQKTAHSPELKSDVEAVLNSADRARDLVQQILTFSRHGEHERHALELQPVVKEAIKMLRATLPANVRIEYSVDPTCPPVVATSNEIHQLLMNLGTNAWHAIQRSDGVIRILLGTTSLDTERASLLGDISAGDYVVLSVGDNGTGMDAEVKERIFDPFFTTKAQGKGTGLGLSVVHGIINSCKGAISVESTPGAGSVFSLYFPMAQGIGLVESKKEEPEIVPSHQRGRILIVDDEKELLHAWEGILKFLGYEVHAVDDPKKALALFRLGPGNYDLLITDLSMPGMDGVSMIAETRALREDIPIILTTGYGNEHDVERMRKYGVFAILRKPATLRGLAEQVHAALAPLQSAANMH